jgi:hypothetical protein
MRRIALGLLAAYLGAAPAGAQPPHAPTVRLRPFDARKAEVRRVNGTWTLLVGGLAFKEFALREFDARESLRILQGLRVTEHGTVGTPTPAMEFWLSDGHAPFANLPNLQLVPLDLNTLCVEEAEAGWVVRDAARGLFTFAKREEAYLALDVIRHYGFTQLGFVGQPVPTLLYFLGSPSDLGRRPALPAPGGVQASSSPAAAPEQAAGLRFDPRRVEVRRDQGEWKLFAGQHVLASFGPHQHEARLAWNIVQHYRFTEQRRLGEPETGLTYFLAGGQAPRGLKFGIFSQSFKPAALVVRQVGETYWVFEGVRPLLSCGPHLDLAQEALEVIRRHQFDHLCRVGPGEGGLGMTFLLRK